MNLPPVRLPNSYRVLQMVHHFERWGTTDEVILEKIRTLQNAGLGGIVVNVNREHYLRDEKSWDFFRRCVMIAHEEGLRIWIYDEEGYPSGTAGGLVLEKEPSVEAQGLIRIVDAEGTPRYEVVTLYEATHATENFYKKQHYPNILDPVTVGTFISLTHDQYARYLEPIDRYVEAFFTDEPSLISVYIPEGREYPQTLPWHPRLPEEFRSRKGYDLLPHRESLFVDTGAIDRKVRCDFYEVIADLCAETYFGGLQKWCRSHNVSSSGHLLGEETMVWQTGFDGDPFTCYRKFDIPGIDMIISNPEKIMAKNFFMVPKIAGSASRLQGVRKVMCEISDYFGRRDNDIASIEQMKCTTALLFSFGVTQLCSYYGVVLDPEVEVKPGQFAIEEYRKYTEFAARVKSVFTTGKIMPRVAVLYPIVSLWAHFTPSRRSMYEPHPDPVVRYLDESFTDLCRSLLRQQIDYDIVDERSLCEAAIEGNSLVVGEERYQVLVLPPADTVRLRTMEKIVRLVEAGVSVFAHPMVPKYAADGPQDNSRINEMIQTIRSAGALGGSAPGSPPIGYLVKSRVPSGCILSPASSNILFTIIHREEGPAYFLVNVSSKSYEGTCMFQDAGNPFLFDPATGEEHPLPREKMHGSLLQVSLSLRPFESLFLLFR